MRTRHTFHIRYSFLFLSKCDFSLSQFHFFISISFHCQYQKNVCIMLTWYAMQLTNKSEKFRNEFNFLSLFKVFCKRHIRKHKTKENSLNAYQKSKQNNNNNVETWLQAVSLQLVYYQCTACRKAKESISLLNFFATYSSKSSKHFELVKIGSTIVI